MPHRNRCGSTEKEPFPLCSILLHSGAVWFILVHSRSFWFHLVPSASFWFDLVRSGSIWFRLVGAKRGRRFPLGVGGGSSVASGVVFNAAHAPLVLWVAGARTAAYGSRHTIL